MDGGQILALIVSGLMGGGIFMGIAALKKAIGESKQTESNAKAVDAKTPAEVESVSVATMNTALESAQRRITALEGERASDKAYYQDRIAELTEKLTSVKAELTAMEEKMRNLILEMEHKVNREGT